MQFKVPKDQDWFAQYNWFQYPVVHSDTQSLNQDLKVVDEKKTKGAAATTKAKNQENSSINANKNSKLKNPTPIGKGNKSESKIKSTAKAAVNLKNKTETKASKVKFEPEEQSGDGVVHQEPTTVASTQEQVVQARKFPVIDEDEQAEFRG
jgi:hypothetical protein